MGEATVIYVAKRIRTMDAARPFARALAVRGDRILAVGELAEVRAQAGPDAATVDLGEATLVPGLIDAHAHLLALGRALSEVELTGTRTSREAVDRVARWPGAREGGEWLQGRGWDQNDWSDLKGAFPSRQALDAALPGRAVFLVRVDGHAAWLSTEALRRAGIDAKTKDPEGGRILRDEKGEPTGILVDNAVDLAWAKIPPPSDAQRQAWLDRAFARCAQVGLTEVHDAGEDLATFAHLQQLDALGALPLRVYAMAEGQGTDREAFLERGPFRGRHLTMRAAKLYADGALGSRGAALHAPYSDDPAQSGLLLTEPGELERRARASMERGFQVAIHAIGDRGNTLAIDALARAQAEAGAQDGRNRVEHVQVIRLEDLPRMKAAGLVASMQPTHATSDMPWAEKRLGKERLAGAYAWRRVLEAGVPLAFGSDFPIELPDPLHGLYAARTRQDAEGKPEGGWLADQRLTGEEALAAFTRGAAYAAFEEDRRGMLRAGMDADFVALSADPVDAPPLEVRNASVRLTVVGGREVYRAREPVSPASAPRPRRAAARPRASACRRTARATAAAASPPARGRWAGSSAPTRRAPR